MPSFIMTGHFGVIFHRFCHDWICMNFKLGCSKSMLAFLMRKSFLTKTGTIQAKCFGHVRHSIRALEREFRLKNSHTLFFQKWADRLSRGQAQISGIWPIL